MHNLAENIKILSNLRIDGTNFVLAAGTDGGVLNSDEWDMAGWDGCLVVTNVGIVAASGVITSTLQNSDTSTSYGSGTVDQIGSSKTNSAAGAGDGLPHVHDVYKPKRRYMRQRTQRTGGNVTINGFTVILYKGHDKPTPAAVYDMLQTLNSPTPSAT